MDEPRDDHVFVEKGASLAKGPNLIIGTILVVYGLSGLLRTAGQQFPSWSSNFPGADVTGASWLGPEINGWTVWLCIAAGALLLFGAAQHHLAKMMSLIVGLALGAAAVIGLVDGDVLGLAAANGWTELGWGVAAAILLLNVFSPRRTRERRVPAHEPAAAGTPVPTYAHGERDGDLADDRTVVGDGRRTDAEEDRTAVATPGTAAEHRDERFMRDDDGATRDDRAMTRDDGALAERDRPAGTSPPRDDRV